jgi:hypothetical protein
VALLEVAVVLIGLELGLALLAVQLGLNLLVGLVAGDAEVVAVLVLGTVHLREERVLPP